MEYGIEDIHKYNEVKKANILASRYIYYKGIILNLSYVTKNFVIMCTPSDTDPVRNHTKILSDYIHETCGTHFWIINLNVQSYDETLFDSKVDFLPFPNHCAPRISYFQDVVKRIINHYQSDPDMTIFCHCNAGRGRSGSVFCAYALQEKIFPTVARVLAELETTRAIRCITHPSQIRYLHYYHHLSYNGAPKHQFVHMKKIEFHPPYFHELTLGIDNGIPYNGTNVALETFNGSMIEFQNDVKLSQEFTIFGYPKGTSQVKLAIIICQLHTDYLIPELHEINKEGDFLTATFSSSQLDGPHHRKNASNFPDGFSMKLYFTVSQE